MTQIEKEGIPCECLPTGNLSSHEASAVWKTGRRLAASSLNGQSTREESLNVDGPRQAGRRGGLYNEGTESGSRAAALRLKPWGTDVCAGNIHWRKCMHKASKQGATASPGPVPRMALQERHSLQNRVILGHPVLRNTFDSRGQRTTSGGVSGDPRASP
jgi:hypothetical protein